MLSTSLKVDSFQVSKIKLQYNVAIESVEMGDENVTGCPENSIVIYQWCKIATSGHCTTGKTVVMALS